jgi:hypothetical protein
MLAGLDAPFGKILGQIPRSVPVLRLAKFALKDYTYTFNDF